MHTCDPDLTRDREKMGAVRLIVLRCTAGERAKGTTLVEQIVSGPTPFMGTGHFSIVECPLLNFVNRLESFGQIHGVLMFALVVPMFCQPG